jgi:hypothetical protein
MCTPRLAPPDLGFSWNVDPLIDGRGDRRRMRGSMDVVDAELLQRSGVAMVGLKEGIY